MIRLQWLKEVKLAGHALNHCYKIIQNPIQGGEEIQDEPFRFFNTPPQVESTTGLRQIENIAGEKKKRGGGTIVVVHPTNVKEDRRLRLKTEKRSDYSIFYRSSTRLTGSTYQYTKAGENNKLRTRFLTFSPGSNDSPFSSPTIWKIQQQKQIAKIQFF